MLALIAGVVWVVRNNNGTSADPSPGISTPPGPGQQSTQPQVPTPKASDAVAAYLRALGTGDATTAMSLAASAPSGDTTFLTNAVLAKATAGKVADVSVAEVTDPNATSVAASYSLDGKPVSATFEVTRVGDQFRLAQIAAKVDISMLRRSTEISLAGVQAKAAFVSLFPGVYPVTATNRNLSVGSVKITVGSLEAQTAGSAKLSLSSAGKSAILKAAKAKYSWCLKQKTVRPSGCGFGVRVPGGVKLQTGTIRWTTRSGGKVSSAKPKLTSSAGWAEAKMKATVHFYARDARVSGRYWYKDIKLTGFQAKLSGSKITVTYY